MPLHSYILAGWLWFFGISTLSFHVFYTGLALAVTLLVYRLLPATSLSCLAALFVCMATYGLLGGAGYRPDSLGLVFVLLGLGIWRTESVAASFLANLCFGFAVITLPTVAVIGMLTSVAVLAYRAIFFGHPLRLLLPYIVATGVAYLLAFLLYLACIHGQLFAALASLHQNEHLTELKIEGHFQLFTPLGICKWLILPPIFFVLLLVVLKSALQPVRPRHLFFLAYIFAGFLWLAYSSFHSSTAGHIWGFACLIGILFTLLWQRWPWPAWVVYALFFPLAAYGHAHVAMQHLFADPMPPAAQLQAIRERVDALKPRKLYLDEYAMREVYGYNLPANAYDYECCSTTGWSRPLDEASIPKDAVFVTSVGIAKSTSLTPSTGSSRRPLRLFGVPLSGVIKNPYQLEIFQTAP
jgi:hypothetical protein